MRGFVSIKIVLSSLFVNCSRKRHHEEIDEFPPEPNKRVHRAKKMPAKFADFYLPHHLSSSCQGLTPKPAIPASSHELLKTEQSVNRIFPRNITVQYIANIKIDSACRKILKKCWSQLKPEQIANAENPECKRYIACIQESRADGLDPWSQKYEVRWIDATIGYGLYAKVSYKRNETIGFYAGYLTRKKENLDYAFEWPDTPYEGGKICIDGRLQGNATRFMNHASEKNGKNRNSANNVSTVEFFYEGLPYIIFIAQRSILAGEQLCYDYGDGYWEHKKMNPTIFT
jgi:hypothetical protein